MSTAKKMHIRASMSVGTTSSASLPKSSLAILMLLKPINYPNSYIKMIIKKYSSIH